MNGEWRVGCGEIEEEEKKTKLGPRYKQRNGFINHARQLCSFIPGSRCSPLNV